jgi:cytochrome c oxidase subunit II
MRLPNLLAKSSPWAGRALLLAGLLPLTGCEWLHMDGPQSTINVEGPVAAEQLRLFYVTCWVTLVIFILVGSTLAYAMIKFRARTEADEHAAPPPQGHGNPFVEMGLIGGSILALVIIAFPTLRDIGYTYDVPAADKANAYSIVATGYQWWFKFEYPSEQIPGAGILTTSNELVIPAGRAVHIDLRSLDVMHSFWVPKLAGKVDMIPNRANLLWLKADHPGYYWGQCAEFCGDSHALMRFRVIALGEKEFNDWLAQQKQPARDVEPVAGTPERPKAQFASLRTFGTNEIGFAHDELEVAPLDAWRAKQFPEKNEDPALIAQGKALFQAKTCFTCHVIRGSQVGGSPLYPDLTHVGARTTIAGGLLENTPEQMQRWIHNPSLVKPGNKMWVTGYVPNHIQLTPDDEVALVAYLQSLK